MKKLLYVIGKTILLVIAFILVFIFFCLAFTVLPILLFDIM